MVTDNSDTKWGVMNAVEELQIALKIESRFPF